ncbi:MAG TPA: murein transglycosylase A [Rhizomicrobium sp.]
MKFWGRLAVLLLAILGAFAVWYSWPQQKPLSRVTFGDLPGWRQGDAGPALAAFKRSCVLLEKMPPDSAMGGYGGTARDWLAACADAERAKDARRFFENDFVPFAVDGGGRGIFTGYYEPQLRGNLTRQGAFQTPVYGLPPDLIRVDLSLFSSQFRGEHVSGKLSGQSLVPYAERAQIDHRGLPDAPILFYTDDPVALFFLQIQGSGRVRFADGAEMRVAYAGENGQPYTAIGRAMIEQGILTRENVSLQSIRDWLRAHPDKARGVMETDKSFVFFKLAPIGDASLGSPGAQGASLTPLASMAIDPRLHPLGAPFFVASGALNGLFIGQDIGGAIRGPVRGDIFFGFGEKAASRAGSMKAEGHLFVLLPTALAARQ